MITTEYVAGINRTPAFALALAAHNELLTAGLASPVAMIGWDDKAIIGLVDGDAVGVITFSHQDWAKSVDIKFGYVKPEFRGRGLYRAMWSALVEKAAELGAVEIFGATHVDNAAMRATARALGRTEEGILLRFVIPAAKAAP